MSVAVGGVSEERWVFFNNRAQIHVTRVRSPIDRFGKKTFRNRTRCILATKIERRLYGETLVYGTCVHVTFTSENLYYFYFSVRKRPGKKDIDTLLLFVYQSKV